MITPATFDAALKAAKTGDTLALEGDFRQKLLIIDSRPGLTFDLSAAQLSAVVVKASAGLRFEGGAVTLAPNGRPGFSIYQAEGMTISGARFEGDGTTNAIDLKECKNVEVSENHFIRPRVGVGANIVDGLRVMSNRIEGWSADAIGMMGVTNAEIVDNDIVDPQPLEGSGIHVDAIQGYHAGTAPSHDILIEANRIRGWATQGIFMSHVDGGPVWARVRVAHNDVRTGDMPRGISLDQTADCEIVGNYVASLAGSKYQTGIQHDKATGLRREGNTVAALGNLKAIIDPPGSDPAMAAELASVKARLEAVKAALG